MKARDIRHAVFAVPGDLATPTGGYAYDRRIVEGLRVRGWRVDVIDLGAHFPRPDNAAREQARVLLSQAPAGVPLIVDGLAFGVIPEIAAALRTDRPLIALVHHPLAYESGLSPADAAVFRASERKALSFAHHAIVTSAATARLLEQDYEVPAARISIVRPGNARQPRSFGRRHGPLRLLAVGSIVPRKGYDVLLAALATLKALSWSLVIVGDPTRDPGTAARLRDDIARLGLGGRVSLAGAVPEDQLAALYQDADVFVLATRFEGYGMAYTEAIAFGLPVIGTKAGAVPDTVPAEAGLLVPPDDAAALAEALRMMIGDTALRGRFAAGAAQIAAALPSWEDSAALFARAIAQAAQTPAPEASVPEAPAPQEPA